MRELFKYLTSLLFLAIVVQVGFAGYGAFNAIDKADKDESITKKTIENGFDPHGLIGTLMSSLMLLLVLRRCRETGPAVREMDRRAATCSGSCSWSSPISGRSRRRSAVSCTGSTHSRSMRGRRCSRIAGGRRDLRQVAP